MKGVRVALATAAVAAAGGCGAIVGLTGDYRDVSGGVGGSGGGVGTFSVGSSAHGGTGGSGNAGGQGGQGGQGGSPQCPPTATCEPGESRPCGNCGTQFCELPDCTFGACQGEGSCEPGTTEPCPGGCSKRICLDTCVWCGCQGACAGDCTPSTTAPWPGCGSTGCAICPTEVAAFPCYFQNHAGCLPEVACGGTPSMCSDACPQPTAADACSCAAPPQGWHGCGASGCDVCSSAVAAYACYFYNHPQCSPDDSCSGGGSGKCSNHCPQPTAADMPTP